MRQVWVFERTAVVVFPWWEPMDPPERGARVEVRLLGQEEHRGSRVASQRIVLDMPMFRADLFDQTNSPPGNLKSAHFHPKFHGVEPTKRHWDEAIQADPIGWLKKELGDLPGLLERSGQQREPWMDADASELRDALPAIAAAVDATWALVRAD